MNTALKNPKIGNRGKNPQAVPQTENRLRKKTNTVEETERNGQDKTNSRNCHICQKLNWTPEHSSLAPKAQCNICKRTGQCAKVCRSKSVNQIQQEEEMGSKTEPRPESDQIQSANSVNRVDFFKAILLIEGQPIEFVTDTGSTIRNIPPIINPNDIQETTKCFVDVNKNPMKFKGEAMVEVKTEKKYLKNCR